MRRQLADGLAQMVSPDG